MFVMGTTSSVFGSTVSGVISRSYSRRVRARLHTYMVHGPGIRGVSMLQAQVFKGGVCISIRVTLSKSVALRSTRSITRGIRGSVRGAFPGMGRVVIRMGPTGLWMAVFTFP